jgi:hypothetical protein
MQSGGSSPDDSWLEELDDAKRRDAAMRRIVALGDEAAPYIEQALNSERHEWEGVEMAVRIGPVALPLVYKHYDQIRGLFFDSSEVIAKGGIEAWMFNYRMLRSDRPNQVLFAVRVAGLLPRYLPFLNAVERRRMMLPMYAKRLVQVMKQGGNEMMVADLPIFVAVYDHLALDNLAYQKNDTRFAKIQCVKVLSKMLLKRSDTLLLAYAHDKDPQVRSAVKVAQGILARRWKQVRSGKSDPYAPQ